MQLALARLDGVYKAEVSLRTEQAVAIYAPDKVTVQQMIETVEKSGFGAEKAP